MKTLSNIQGPIGGEPLCFHEAASVFIGHEHETCSLNWGAGAEGSAALFGCLHQSKKTGEAPTQVFGISKFSVVSEKKTKLKQFLADFCFCRVCTNANCVVHRHVVCTQYKKACMVILNPSEGKAIYMSSLLSKACVGQQRWSKNCPVNLV